MISRLLPAVDIRRSPLVLNSLSKEQKQQCQVWKNLMQSIERGEMEEHSSPAPVAVTVEVVNVPLLERELRISDQLCGGSPGQTTLDALGLPMTFGTPQDGGLAGARYMADKAKHGRGVGLFNIEGIEVGSSSKGKYLLSELQLLTGTGRRTVVFTHLAGRCGYEGLQNLLKEEPLSLLPFFTGSQLEPPGKKFGSISRDMPFQRIVEIQNAFNAGVFNTLLVHALAEGLSFNNVQTMFVTEPTNSPATWTQEIARVARLGSYEGSPYYSTKGTDPLAKAPRILQLISVLEKPSEREIAIGRAVQYVAIPTLMLGITSALDAFRQASSEGSPNSRRSRLSG